MDSTDESLSMMLPSDELSHIIIISIARIITTSSMSTDQVSDFMHFLNYDSPVSPFNIHRSISSAFVVYQYQYHDDVHYFTTAFPALLSQVLCSDLTLSILDSIHTFSLPLASPYDFIHWLINTSPISPININHTLSPFINTFRYQYQSHQPPLFYGGLFGGFLAADETSDQEYEDMLDLQEQIGYVNVGLPEKSISINLKTSLVPASKVVKHEICVVCQGEYKLNDTIGTLHCGHAYHADCIKNWLLQKNVCPLCKSTALLI